MITRCTFHEHFDLEDIANGSIRLLFLFFFIYPMPRFAL
jgi:hypothetical protein